MKNIIISLIVIVCASILVFVLNIDNSKFYKNYNIRSKEEIDITSKEEYKKVLNKKNIIIFVGNSSAISNKYAKEISKIAKDYNKKFYYYEDNDVKVIGIDKDKNKEEFNKKTKINAGIDKIFDDVTSGACTEEEKC